MNSHKKSTVKSIVRQFYLLHKCVYTSICVSFLSRFVKELQISLHLLSHERNERKKFKYFTVGAT